MVVTTKHHLYLCSAIFIQQYFTSLVVRLDVIVFSLPKTGEVIKFIYCLDKQLISLTLLLSYYSEVQYTTSQYSSDTKK